MYRKILLGGATAAVVLGAGTTAVALTGSSATAGTPSATSASSTTTPGASGTNAKAGKAAKAGKHGKHGGRLLAHAAHAQITIKTKDGYVTHDLIRGTVTSVSSSSITVQSGDKTTETFSVGTTTKVVARAAAKGSKPTASTISKVAKGDTVIVSGTGTSALTAKHIVDLAK